MHNYSSDPVLDASRHYDAMYDREDRMQAGEKAARAQITKTLTLDIRKVTPSSLLLQAVSHSLGGKVIYQQVADVISDRIGYGKPLASLLQVLQQSDCPYVATLRQVLADDYADSHADELGMVMGDEE